MTSGEQITILGSGPAGLTAAIYAARAGFAPLILSGLQQGGQLTTTSDVENFPGFREPVMGPKLMEDMVFQAERVGAKFLHQEAVKVDLKAKPFVIHTEEKTFTTQTLIIATGATSKMLGLPEDSQFLGKGLSTCATCDGFFYKGKDVVVVGGGDSAMEEALYLANLCKQVFLVHRREEFRASHIMAERVKKHPKVVLKTSMVVEKLLGDEKKLLNGVKLRSLKDSSHEETLSVDGVFYAIGHSPNTDLFKSYLPVDDHGYLKTEGPVRTSIPGVFAAGDVADPHYKQAITAAGMGCQAALEASKFLKTL